MNSDGELLRRYAEDGDEAAFAEVVRRQVDLVYSAAVRLVGGDEHLAEDVTQGVFTALARQARGLSRRASIAGWLYTTARFIAAKIRRGERRRLAREQEAFIMNEDNDGAEIKWDGLRPTLDEAVGALNATDREAVLLRFFQNKTHQEVGELLGMNEDTARKRGERALEKLRGHFGRRGVRVSAGLLAAAIMANSVQAAPVGLAGSVTGAALAGAGAGGGAFFLQTFSTFMKTKTALAAAAILAVAGLPMYFQQSEIVRLRGELAQAQPRSTGAAGAEAGNAAAGDAKYLTFAEVQAKIRFAAMADGKAYQVFEQQQLDRLLKAINPADYGRVLADVDQMPVTSDAPDRRRDLRYFLVLNWGRNDPHAAINYALGVKGDAGNRSYAVSAALGGWSEKDPDAAADWLLQFSDSSFNKSQLTNYMMDDLEAKDPAKAYQIFEAYGRGNAVGNSRSLKTLFADWAAQDPATATAKIAELPPGDERMGAITGVADGWSVADQPAALAWAEGLTHDDEKAAALKAIVTNWADANPQAAAAYVLSLPAGQARSDSLAVLAGEWADGDPQGALGWALQLPDGVDKQKAEAEVVAQWAQTDAAAALGYAQGLPAGSERDTLLGSMAKAWATEDPKDTLAWFASLPEGENRAAVLSGFFTQLTQSDAADAAGLVSVFPAEEQGRAIQGVVHAWAQDDVAAAAAWVGTLPEDAARTQAAGVVAGSFAGQDPQAASQWLETLPAGPTLDAAAQSFVKRIRSVDAPLAAPWALAIGNETARDQAVEGVAQNWLEADPAAGAAWLAQTGLPEARKQRLLQKAQSGY